MERKAHNRPMVTDFWNRLCKNCPMCKENTCKQYAYSLGFLKKHLGDKFEDIPTVLEFLKTGEFEENDPVKITTSRRLQCTCALKVWHRRVLKKEENSNRLEEPLRLANVEQAKHLARKNQKPSKDWVHMPDARKDIRDLRKSVLGWDRNMLWGKTRFHQAQLAFFMNYMLCGGGPCRRDLCNVTYGEGPQRIDHKSHEIVFDSMNKDRKGKDREVLKVKLCRDSWALFSRLRKQHRLRGLAGERLLYNKHFQPLTSTSLNAYLSKLCSDTLPCFQKKKCTCTLLRRMFVSWKRRGDLSSAEKEDIANNMNHSPTMQNGYVQENVPIE